MSHQLFDLCCLFLDRDVFGAARFVGYVELFHVERDDAVNVALSFTLAAVDFVRDALCLACYFRPTDENAARQRKHEGDE